MTAILKLAFADSRIADDLADALARVETRFDDQLVSDIPTVNTLCKHIEQYRGKMLRPTLVFLAGLTARPDDANRPSDNLVTVAAVLEMIHMATLVHDDVLDEADLRRNTATINTLHGNETAVMLGDYLLARSYHLCSQLETQATALRVGEITATVCEGEMLQLANRGKLDLGERLYFDIIQRKTAALIAGAMELGARHAGATEAQIRDMHEIGLRLGVAFQIQDDLLDLLGDERTVGKSLGKDVDKGKLTLPIIHHLEKLDPARRESAQGFIAMLPRKGDEAHHTLVDALHETGSIAYAKDKAASLVNGAKAMLAGFPASSGREALLAAADSVVNRAF